MDMPTPPQTRLLEHLMQKVKKMWKIAVKDYQIWSVGPGSSLEPGPTDQIWWLVGAHESQKMKITKFGNQLEHRRRNLASWSTNSTKQK
jgi:hypothetical protein